MNIVHFVPYGPNSCGLYEAARDMIIADRLMGHTSNFVDVGSTYTNGKKDEPKVGQIDSRGGTVVQAMSPEIVNDADIIVAHTGVSDSWIAKCQAPIIWVLHGRPTACFKPEQLGISLANSYSLISELAKWPRIKAMITFWDSHVEFWKVLIPKEKLYTFNYPPIDENRFCQNGSMYDFGGKLGRFNILISESMREDIDIYELLHGVILYARESGPDIKVHLFGMDLPVGIWEHLINELRNLDVLGVVWGRRNSMEEVYRAADIVLSPQKIITRSVGEALSCGTPVLADEGCPLATYTTRIDNPFKVAETLDEALYDIQYNRKAVINAVKSNAELLSLKNYGYKMSNLYEQLVPTRQVPPREEVAVSPSASATLPELQKELA